MANSFPRSNLKPAARFLWRCLAGFTLFVQVAAASGLCVDSGGCGGDAQQLDAYDFHGDHGRVDRICGSEVVPADQVSVTDPISHVPDLSPAFTVVTLATPTSVLQVRRLQYALPSAHIAQFLLLRRLQL